MLVSIFFKLYFSLLFFFFSSNYFYHHLHNLQKSFRSVGMSLLKTSVMMIGEFEFDSIFNPDNPQDEIYYRPAAYIIWVIFLVIMSIILMNLLVRLKGHFEVFSMFWVFYLAMSEYEEWWWAVKELIDSLMVKVFVYRVNCRGFGYQQTRFYRFDYCLWSLGIIAEWFFLFV